MHQGGRVLQAKHAKSGYVALIMFDTMCVAGRAAWLCDVLYCVNAPASDKFGLMLQLDILQACYSGQATSDALGNLTLRA